MPLGVFTQFDLRIKSILKNEFRIPTFEKSLFCNGQQRSNEVHITSETRAIHKLWYMYKMKYESHYSEEVK